MVKMTKREKQEAKKALDRMRRRATTVRKNQPPPPLQLRERQLAGAVLETKQPVGQLRGPSTGFWAPRAGDVVQLLPGKNGRMVIGVAHSRTIAMLDYLAPAIFATTGTTLAVRGNDPTTRRGASLILTTERSSSDPHYDQQDTLALCLSGRRYVWVAPPAAAHPKTGPSREYDTKGGAVFLPDTCDPSLHSHASCLKSGIEWSEMVVLEAGDAIYIQRWWWHCFLAEAGGVAIPIEIVSKEIGSSGVASIAPKVFRHVGTRHVSGRDCERSVSRRVGWGSAAGVLELWAPALAAFECQQWFEANKTAIAVLKGRFKPGKPKKGEKPIQRCERFDREGIPCKRLDCCSVWPCHDWEQLLATEARAGGLSKTVYADMPDYIRSRGRPGLHSSRHDPDGLERRSCGPPSVWTE
jgi:hypothetical protein